jgi:DNA-binding transcriptional LysR family regulator
MDLRQLAALRAIAETGSFHEAGNRLSITQSAVSYQIQNLERELGQTMIYRSRPHVALSPAGREALRAYERILAEIDGLRRRLGGDADAEIAGELRVASSILGIVYLYGDLIGDFIYSHPRIEVKVTATESGFEGGRQVLARKADVGFVAFPHETPQLQSVTLGTSEHVVIAAANHRLAASGVVTVEMLRQHPFVRYATGAGSRYITDRLFLATRGYPPIALESNDTEFIKRTVRLGLGLAIVPSFTVSPQKDPELRILRIEGRSLAQKFGLVFRRDLRMKTLDLFCRFARERAGNILPAKSRPRRHARP